MTRARINVSDEKLAAFCRKHHIQKLSLFGSVLGPDFHSDSDVDILVEFVPGQGPGLIGLYEMEMELSQIMGGRKLDLVTPKFLNHRIREQVMKQAEVRYAA